MRFSLSISKENIYSFLRECGYHPTGETARGEQVFVKIIGSSRSGYPRFHLYANPYASEGVEFNLHLDQKKPIYKGAPAHGGEYEGTIVEAEAERIKSLGI